MKTTTILSCIIFSSAAVALPEGLFGRQLVIKPTSSSAVGPTATVTVTTTKPCYCSEGGVTGIPTLITGIVVPPKTTTSRKP